MYYSHEHANDSSKSKEGLIKELHELRGRVAALEADRDKRCGARTDRAECDRIFRLITDNVDEVIFMFTPDWREAIYVSPAYESIWGRPVDEVYRDSRSWTEAIVAEDRDRMAEFIDGQARGEVAYENSIDFRIRTPDSNVRWIHGRTYPVMDERGKIYRITGIAEDVTERKNAEERLQDSEKFLNNIFDCFQDGISILDRDLNIVRVNHVMEKWHPYMMPLCGKKCYHVYHERSAPCEQCPSIRAIETGTAQSEVVPFHGEGGELRGWLELFAYPLTDEVGSVTGVIEHVRDITGRKRAENALRESEEKYRSLAENINDMVWEMDENFQVTYASARTTDILGYEAEEVIGKSPFTFILPADLDRFGALIDETFRARAPMELVGYRARRKDGRIIYVETNGMPIFEGDGSFRGYRGINRDITARMQAEEALRENEDFLKSIFDCIQDGISIFDRDYNIIRVNKTMERWHAEAMPLVGKKCYEAYHCRSEPCEYCPGITAMEQGTTQVIVVPREAYGRIVGWQEIHSFPLTDDRGNPKGCINYVRDITDRKRAEESLQLMQHMIDQTQDEASLAGPDGRFRYVNDAKCRSLGYTREELLSMNVWDVDPDISPEIWSRAWKNLKEKGYIKLETRHRTKDGRTFPTEIWSTYINFHGCEYVCAFVRDISERKHAEKSLKLTQFTMDRAGEMVLWVAPDSRFTYVNEAACRAFGYTREEMTAMTTFDTCPAWTPESWAEHWREIKERGSFTFEVSLRKKDGSFFPAEISVNYLVYNGKEYNCSFIRDITERKRAEEALKESEEKFRVLAETTRAGIMLYRGKKVVYVNPALEQITGYGSDELLGKDYWYVVDPEQREIVRSRGLARQRGLSIPSTYEVKLRTKGGEARWVELSGALISYQGKQTGLATIFDITGRKRSEKELQEAKSEAELYLDLMGHDINNLNQIGIGFLEIALSTLRLDRESRELIAKPLESLEASTRLIANVRKLQKVRDGGLKFHAIGVGEMIRRIVPRYVDVAGREIRINCYASCDCQVIANDLLDDVFSNIIGNAINHSAGPLTIDVHVSDATVGGRKYCLVAIEDDGPGITDNQKERLFTRFERGRARSGGKGLGLYLVRTLVEDFHGKVWVEDRVNGDHTQGARFMVMLPEADKTSL